MIMNSCLRDLNRPPHLHTRSTASTYDLRRRRSKKLEQLNYDEDEEVRRGLRLRLASCDLRVPTASGLINCELTNMDANSSHASVNPPTTTTPTTTNTRSDANTTSVSANKDMAWEWGVQKDPLKKQNIWCTLCDKRVCGGITRLQEHLTHIGGNVAACPNVTTEITKKVLESMKEKDKKKKERQRTIEILRSTSCIDHSENDDEQDDTPQPQVKKRKFVSSSNVRGPIDDVYKPDHGKGKQTTLDKNNPIKEKLKKVAWKKIAV
ncbi:unnamed protein product [Lactuca saligna]|uniref:BED-type domain-containing protein n=1 Tax=Lactuca saligna TaxID=75948 RepID=A0AA35VDA9_LACSI|nr:unnamed protein product [Lactuca saligna]